MDEEAQKTVDLIKKKFPEVAAYRYHCDVTSTEDIKLMYHAIMRDVGKVDILINNAGILRRNLIHKMDDNRLDRVIDINLKSQFKVRGECTHRYTGVHFINQYFMAYLFIRYD